MIRALLAVSLVALTGCSDSHHAPVQHTRVETPARTQPQPASHRAHHPSHEHPHGPHPHPRSDHHHHPHPHPHLEGQNGHHHPY